MADTAARAERRGKGYDTDLSIRPLHRLLRITPLVWIALLALPLYLSGLNSTSFSFGEGMYPEVAREMRLSGDFITPHLNGTPHFDKPPLLYWLVALNQGLFGGSEFAARLWPTLAAWMTIIVVGAIGATLYGRRAGWLAALMYATSLGPYLYGRQVLPDPLLVFSISLAVLGYLRGFAISSGSRRWLAVTFVCLGTGFLSKGLLGVLLPMAIIGLHLALTGTWRRFFTSPRWILGGLLSGAIALPWVVAAARANPDFLGYFFIREHLMRFTGARFPADEFVSLPLFLAITLVWTFPWITLAPQALTSSVKRLFQPNDGARSDLLLLIWIAVVVGLFAASRSRLEYYGLPALPAITLLLGRYANEHLNPRTDGARTPLEFAFAALAVLLIVVATAAFVFLGPASTSLSHAIVTYWPTSGWQGMREQSAVLEQLRTPAIVVPIGLALAATYAWIEARRQRIRAAIGITAVVMIPILALTNWGFRTVGPFMSPRGITDLVSANAGPRDVIVLAEPHEYMWVGGIDYYTGRYTDILRDPRMNGVSDHRREPPSRFLNARQLSMLWKSRRRVLLILPDDGAPDPRWNALQPKYVLGYSGNYAVISNK